MGCRVAAYLLLVALAGCQSVRSSDERVFSGRVEVNGSTCGASPIEPVANAEVRLVFNDGSSKVLGHSNKAGYVDYRLPESEVDRILLILVCHRDCCFCGALTHAKERIKEGPAPYIFLAPIVVY